MTEIALLAILGGQSEKAILKSQSRDESDSESSMSSVEENTRRNKRTLRFQKSFNSRRRDSANFDRKQYQPRSLSRSLSPIDRKRAGSSPDRDPRRDSRRRETFPGVTQEQFGMRILVCSVEHGRQWISR